MDNLFSYRTYYAINSLVWEGEKGKSSQIHCVCNLFCCPTHSTAARAHSWTGQCCHAQTLLRPFQVLSNPRSSHELCLAGLLFFLPGSFAELGSNVVAWCGWTDRRTPLHQVTVAPNLDKAVQSPHICHGFFKNSWKIRAAVLLIRPGIHQRASKIRQMTDQPDRLKPKGSAKHVWVTIKNCYTLNQHCLIIFHLLWVSVF